MGVAGAVVPAVASASGGPSFGPNVIVFNPSMPQSEIQSMLDAISAQQVPNQFGTQRYAIMFEPGTYGSKTDPLVFQVGYYTQVAGVGRQPGDVVINGAIDVFNGSDGTGLENFWRSVSNLTLNVTLPSSPPNYAPAPPESPGCANQQEFWAVSQAAPMRRVVVNGNVLSFDYCNTGPFVSGGFLADDEFQNGAVINGVPAAVLHPKQRYRFLDQRRVEPGVHGRQRCAGDQLRRGPNYYTTLPSTPVSEEEPFLYTDSSGDYNVFVPAVRHDSVGPSYASSAEAGTSIPLRHFFVANPARRYGRSTRRSRSSGT